MRYLPRGRDTPGKHRHHPPATLGGAKRHSWKITRSGPVTPKGKATSARNRYTHGMLSKLVVIEGEEGRRFTALLNTLRDDLLPRNTTEESLIEDLAICKWRQPRQRKCSALSPRKDPASREPLASMETAFYSTEIRRQDPTVAAATPVVRAAHALSGDTHALQLINRYEQAFDRQYSRTIRRLHTLRSLEKNIPDDSNPTSC